MDYKKYLEQELEKQREQFWGIQAEGYENGIEISEDTKHYPRENNPFIEVNSTLLIPEKYYEKFKEKVIRYGGVRAYVAHLLFKYKIHIVNGLVPAYSNHTTKYQEKNQNLVRIAFRPRLDDWAELKLYRVSFGMSISAFLVYLLIADFVEFAQTVSYFLGAVGISQSPDFDLWAKIYLSRKNSEYSTIFQHQRSSDS